MYLTWFTLVTLVNYRQGKAKLRGGGRFTKRWLWVKDCLKTRKHVCDVWVPPQPLNQKTGESRSRDRSVPRPDWPREQWVMPGGRRQRAGEDWERGGGWTQESAPRTPEGIQIFLQSRASKGEWARVLESHWQFTFVSFFKIFNVCVCAFFQFIY